MRPVIIVAVLGLLLALAIAPSPSQAEPTQEWSDPALLWSEDEIVRWDWAYAHPLPIVPEVALNDKGIAIALWADRSLHASRFTPELGWGPLFEVSSETGALQQGPKVALNSHGQAVAVWQSFRGSFWESNLTYYVYALPFSVDGLTVSSSQQHLLASWLVDNRSFAARSDWAWWSVPQVQIDSAGNILVVWHQWDSNQARDRVYSARYVANSGWEPPVAIDAGIGSAVLPRLAMDDSGIALAAWSELNGTVRPGFPDYNPHPEFNGTFELYAARFMPGLGWEEPEYVGPVGVARNVVAHWLLPADAAINGAGEAAVAWTSGRDYQTFVSVSESGSGWSLPTLLVFQRDPPGRFASDSIPQVAVGPLGDVTVVWSGYDAALPASWGSGVYAARLNRVGEPDQWVTVLLGKGHNWPQIAVEDSGSVTLTWVRDNLGEITCDSEANFSVESSRFSASGGWEGTTQVATLPGRPSNLAFSMNSQGDTVIVGGSVKCHDWNDLDFEHRIWASFRPDSTPPMLRLSEPVDGVTTTNPVLRISGRTEPGTIVSVNGVVAEVRPDGFFLVVLGLEEGQNQITVTARDRAGNEAVRTALVTYEGPLSALEEQLRDTNRALDEANARAASQQFQTLLLAIVLAAALTVVALFLAMSQLRGRGGSGFGVRSPGRPESPGKDSSPPAGPREPGNDMSPVAGRRPSSSNSKPVLGLSSKERVLLHLARYAGQADESDVSAEVTQAGISVAAWFDQRHFTQYVRPLLRDGLLAERVARPRGARQRQKVYEVTHEGRRVATIVADRVKKEVVKVWDGEQVWEVRVSELLRKMSQKASVLDVARYVTEEEVVDLGALVADNDLETGAADHDS